MRNPLRDKLKKRQTTYGLWVTLESPSVTEVAVMLGFDWVVVDMEHGHLGFKEVLEHLRVVRGSDTAALVRVPEVGESAVKRALDLGSHGVVLPMVRSAAEVERGFRMGRYPSRGARGVGGERAVTWGLGWDDYLKSANEETLIVPLIETREAALDIDAILMTEGLEAIFLGPADLSATSGFLGEWEGGDVGSRVLEIHSKATAKGIAAGIMARAAGDSVTRRDQGFGMIALGADLNLMIRAVRENFAALGHQVTPGRCL